MESQRTQFVISVIKMPNVTEALSLLRGENFLFLLLLYVN